MAKGKVARAKNVKLRKQIRRTFGALFMASAIAVAAIPVQEIEAGKGVDTILTGGDTRASINYSAPTNPTELTTEIDLDPAGKTETESYIIRQLSDGSWSMNWQFKYYIVTAKDGSDRAIISQYNPIYPVTTVALNNTANSKYYEVSSTEYNSFYATSGSYSGTGTTATATPATTPSATPTATAASGATPTATAASGATPTATATTGTPTTAPTATSTAVPTETPTAAPTESPTAAPTETPTAAPTATPTATPIAGARLNNTDILDAEINDTTEISGVTLNHKIALYAKPALGQQTGVRMMLSSGTGSGFLTGTTAGNRDYVFAYDDTVTTFSGTEYYTDYKKSGQKGSVFKWYETYRPEVISNFITLCDKYYAYEQAQAQYVIDKAYYDSLSDKTGATEPVAPSVVTKPTYVKINPSTDFTESEKLAYYCDFDTKLSPYGSDYSLVAVNDNRTGSSSGTTSATVYLAKGGTPIGTAYNDGNGFLVVEKSKEILGIANGAFQGITNVDYLTIPTEIAYIGDDAFNGSFLKSIDIKNAANIGHRAFKGCTQLTSVTLAGTKVLGVECFENSGITSITFPYSLTSIGYGAFANCKNLLTVDFGSVNNSCVLDAYAFFNCYRLNSVNMESSEIAAIEEGVFAVTSNPSGSWTDIVLPTHIQSQYQSKDTLGDLMFAGRTNLKTVTYPSDFGTSSTGKIPSGTFRNCVNLSSLNFHPGKGNTLCGNVSYEPDLFVDVTNTELVIYGPEKNVGGQTALPRKSTWNASAIGLDNIPYIYIDSNGIECYEVSDGTYLLQANEKGELSSCTLVDPTDKTTPIDLVIPTKVGNYTITSIGSGCFEDETLRNRIRSITIEDNSISSLAEGVFKGLPNLEWVEIGNSVQSIGTNAFANCPKLIDVTFHTPSVGYTGFTIGTDAFKTGSNELTIHGDIVPGYAPFDFAMGVDSGKIDDNGKRICYKSLSPDLLTVMYDNASGETTLLDYPKYDLLDTEHAAYNTEMEKYYYNKYGSAQSQYDTYRDEFAAEWVKACDATDPATAKETLYNSVYYGPWIDEAYTKTGGGFDTYLAAQSPALSGYAYPSPFYTRQPYSITDNYERGSSARGEFEAVTDSELQWIQACLNIVIPAGVTSIDATGFFNATENTRNVSTYFDTTSDSYKMCTSTTDGAVPGLFSGYYRDYATTDPEYGSYETPPDHGAVKGNDRILSIIMNDVKELPEYAFDNCEKLETVILGDDLADIGKAPFRGCPLMTSITGNAYYTADNGILYSVNTDGTYTIEECLSARGNGVGQSYMNSTTDPTIPLVSAIREGAFEDCDNISKVYLTDSTVKIIPKDCFKDCDILTTVDLPDTTSRIEEGAFENDLSLTVTIPADEVNIATDAFEHDSRVTIATYEDSAAMDYAKYYGLSTVVLDARYKVEFVDYDGTELAAVQYIESGKSATPPADPTRTGYTFTGWSTDYNNVQKNLLVIAQYESNSSDEMRHTVTFYNYDDTVVSTQKVVDGDSAVAPLAPTRSGYTFTGWKPTTYTKVTKDLDIYAQFINNSSGSTTNPTTSPNSSASPSSSVSPTPTATPASETKYTVTVSGGSGTGNYSAGTVVSINAFASSGGNVFDKWTTSTAGVGFVDASNPTTTFTMPAANVAVTATYKAGTGTASTEAAASGATTTAANTTGTTGNGTTDGSGSSVQVDSDGISNPGLASASVNGSTDNFIVKITDDPAATEAAKAALQERYGDISAIEYLPMDISLYDSTGRTKITDTSGITVDITIPLPDALVQYAGNNKAASVAGGSIEDLSTSFTTIGGVPCISFTATHFSPYMVYVDTTNLTAGSIDATPKTGDMIHPKWFLAIGLACVSLILFFKRDKKLAVKLEKL